VAKAALEDVEWFLGVDLEKVATSAIACLCWTWDLANLIHELPSRCHSLRVEFSKFSGEVIDPRLLARPRQVSLGKGDCLANLCFQGCWLLEECWSSEVALLADQLLPLMEQVENVVATDEGECLDIEADGALAASTARARPARQEFGMSADPILDQVIELAMDAGVASNT
jgi:hypothetical protein